MGPESGWNTQLLVDLDDQTGIGPHVFDLLWQDIRTTRL